MKTFLLLTKIQLSSLFSTSMARYSADAGVKKRARTRRILFVVMGLTALIMSASYSFLIAMSLEPLGQLYLLPAMMALAVSLLSFISALSRARTVLFGAADYDMLMSLPLKRSAIVASRLFSFYSFELLFAVLLMLPCGLIYALYAAPDWSFYVLFLLCLPLIPLIPAAIGGVFGTLVAALFARSRLRNLFNTVVLMTLVIGLFAASMFSYTWIENLGELAGGLMGNVSPVYPFAAWFAQGVCLGDFGALFAFALSSLAAAALFCALAGLGFKRFNSLLSASYSAGRYQLKRQRAGSQLAAMYRKEWRRYASIPIYVMNTMFGNIILVLGAAVAVFGFRDTVLGFVKDYNLSALLGPALALAMGWFSGLGVTTTASVSIEGKTLWISKQLPVPATTWLAAKMLVSFTVSVPATLVSALLLTFGLRLSAADALLLVFVPLAAIFSFSVFGLWLNLKNHKFDWKHETEVVKQGTPIMVIALGSMLLFGLLAAAVFLLPSFWTLMGCALLLLIPALFLWRYLTRNGERLRLRL
ncbi:MAG: hypothetical protein FWE69_04040 [Clostridiales bacterium]|nr:hypothetical protein [Clostridiales bacterium]